MSATAVTGRVTHAASRTVWIMADRFVVIEIPE